MVYSGNLVDETIQPVRSNQWPCRAGAGILLILGVLCESPAPAQELDGNAIQQLAHQGIWAAEQDWGYWSWSADKKVCLRLFGADGDCADTGTWNLDGDVMCYELTWWGESEGVRKNCVTVHGLGDGRYETQYHGGALASTFYFFRVLE
jgi:hypothetical protein